MSNYRINRDNLLTGGPWPITATGDQADNETVFLDFQQAKAAGQPERSGQAGKADEDILHDILGLLFPSHYPHGSSQQRAFVALHQYLKKRRRVKDFIKIF